MCNYKVLLSTAIFFVWCQTGRGGPHKSNRGPCEFSPDKSKWDFRSKDERRNQSETRKGFQWITKIGKTTHSLKRCLQHEDCKADEFCFGTAKYKKISLFNLPVIANLCLVGVRHLGISEKGVDLLGSGRECSESKPCPLGEKFEGNGFTGESMAKDGRGSIVWKCESVGGSKSICVQQASQGCTLSCKIYNSTTQKEQDKYCLKDIFS